MAGYVLDLRPLIEETLDITLSDNNVLHIKKPAEAMVQRLSQQVNSIKIGDKAQDEQLEGLNKLTLDVLNQNTDGKVVPEEFVRDGLPIDAKLAIITAYASFAVKLDRDPNLPARPSRARKADGPTRSHHSTP